MHSSLLVTLATSTGSSQRVSIISMGSAALLAKLPATTKGARKEGAMGTTFDRATAMRLATAMWTPAQTTMLQHSARRSASRLAPMFEMAMAGQATLIMSAPTSRRAEEWRRGRPRGKRAARMPAPETRRTRSMEVAPTEKRPPREEVGEGAAVVLREAMVTGVRLGLSSTV